MAPSGGGRPVRRRRSRAIESRVAPPAPVPRSVRLGVGLLAVAYVALFTWVTLTRTGSFSPDSMNYVDVARHVARGDGLVQSTLGFNRARYGQAETIPTPFTSQAPLYPLIVAAAIRAGAPAPMAALCIATVFYFATIAIGALLARAAFGPAAAWLAGALLIVLEPLRLAGTVAWSDTLGVAASGAALVFLLRTRTGGGTLATGLAAGLAAGMAFATRYSLLPLALLGAVMLRARLAAAGAFVCGWAALALPLLLRTHHADGTWFGPARNPSTLGLARNAHDALAALLGGWAGSGMIPAALQGLVACGLVAVATVALARRGELRERLWGNGRLTLPLWTATYLAALVLERTRTHFDPIDARLVLPAAVPATLVVAGLLAAAVPRVAQARYAALMTLAALTFGVVREARTSTLTSGRRIEDEIARSPRLAWIASHATARDLIVGDDAVDVPFYFPGRRALSFSLYPYTDRPTRESLVGYVYAHCTEYERVFLLLRPAFRAEKQWRHAYGPFVADLVFADSVRDAAIRRITSVDDAFVLRIDCRESPAGGSREAPRDSLARRAATARAGLRRD